MTLRGSAFIRSPYARVIGPARPTQLSLTTQPSATASSGVALAQQPVVQLRDAANNAVSQAGVVITASVATGTSSLSGSTTATTNAFGVATFTTLALTGADTDTVQFSAAGLSSVTSTAIVVGGVTPLLTFDPSIYATIAALLADSTRLWTGEAFNTGRLALDNGVAVAGSTKSLRYDWPNNGTAARDYKISPGQLRLPDGVTEAWWTRFVRFGPGFTTDAGATDGTGAEYKLGAFGDLTTPGVTGRGNNPEMQASQLAGGYPGQDASFKSNTSVGNTVAGGNSTSVALLANPSTWWGDGLFHELRTHYKHSHSGAGIFRFMVDGRLLWEQTGFSGDATTQQINAISMGLNMNQGPNATMSHWVGKVVVYTADPSWGI